MKLIAGILMATLAAGADDPGFRELVPQVVSTARDHALRSGGRGTIAGPVLVDAASFSVAGRALGESVSAQAVAQAAGAGARAVAPGQGVVCTEPTAATRRSCEVAGRGVVVSMQSATRTAQGLDVVVTTRWTYTRTSGAVAVAAHMLRLSYEEQGRGWRLKGKKILRQT
ncbi:MAG TPA: hypothetical protein VK399_05370 [Longimicrobiaceae bacterium]|jgi:hypothetical protein|nr:hypothetical protein [Longimicrobiaceae bacterium]